MNYTNFIICIVTGDEHPAVSFVSEDSINETTCTEDFRQSTLG